jgi:hypothetical protein
LAILVGLVRQFDRLIAGMEVSRTYPYPVVSLLLLCVGTIGLTIVAEVTGTQPILAGRIYATAWLLVLGLELGRDIWARQHRYASPRWLRAVEAAVGNEVIVHALADLIRRHRHDANYTITRADLRAAVQAERACRRDAANRAEGFRLVEEQVGTTADANADAERRRRARERRSARRAQAAV